MAQHDASRSASDEHILRDIAAKERELREELTRTQAEAARLIEDAQRQADAVRARAQEQVRQEAAAAATVAAAEAEATTERILSKARGDAEAMRKRAEERIGRAVEFVVREVLGGRS